ncbi:hydroxyacylglutathione hydrolase [Pseudoalteromonas xiamenensis]
MVQVEAIPAFNDNYIWLIKNSETQTAFVVDPGDAQAVKQALSRHALQLEGILLTHHHWDHTDGVNELKAAYPNSCVYGPANSPFTGIDVKLSEHDTVKVHDKSFFVLETPGHTLDHICYVCDQFAFTGDTLFHGGCGRLFEGTATQMWQSLTKLADLPDSTLIYCTHEYTQANLGFALSVEPDNTDLHRIKQRVDTMRAHAERTIPTSIGEQKRCNPFLRAPLAHILENCPPQYIDDTALPENRFAALRKWKDHF